MSKKCIISRFGRNSFVPATTGERQIVPSDRKIGNHTHGDACRACDSGLGVHATMRIAI